MRDAVLFNGANALDFQDIRTNVIRIPEVITRIRQAQKIWEQNHSDGFDLANFIGSDDRIFMGNIKLKNLAACVVQVGLLDRLMKIRKRPGFLVGPQNGDSPLLVAAGLMTFEDMVRGSQALKVLRPTAPVQLAPQTPVLSGVSLTEYAAYQWTPDADGGGYQMCETPMMELPKVIRRLIDENEVKQFVNIGPGNLLLNRFEPEYELLDLQVLESIDLDPMLNWFWPQMREHEVVRAQ